jgi:hypothetical protein
VKLQRSTNGRFVFQLSRRDKMLLLEVLKLYPRICSGKQPLSKGARLDDHEASQHMLEEAVAEQRAANKKQLETLLTDPRRFADTETGCRMTLSAGDVEWLLQVFNDVRVGSWVHLGLPEERIEKLTLENAPHLWAMEMAGYFESQLLKALEA